MMYGFRVSTSDVRSFYHSSYKIMFSNRILKLSILLKIDNLRNFVQ